MLNSQSTGKGLLSAVWCWVSLLVPRLLILINTFVMFISSTGITAHRVYLICTALETNNSLSYKLKLNETTVNSVDRLLFLLTKRRLSSMLCLSFKEHTIECILMPIIYHVWVTKNIPLSVS